MTTPPSHGHYRRYKTPHNCRCAPCSYAMSAYNTRRARAIADGEWQPYADAATARHHLQRLVDAGIGYQRITELSGVDHDIVSGIHKGRRGRLLTTTEQRLLAVRFDPAHITPGRATDATGTRRRIEALAARGWPKAQLAVRLGCAKRHLCNRVHRKQVTVGFALAVRALYDRLWDQDPAAHGVSAQAVTNARNRAARCGWPPPLAWDDDTIDNPDARPQQPKPEGCAADAIVEDADELFAQGYTFEQAAERLGITERHLVRCRAVTRDTVREAS